MPTTSTADPIYTVQNHVVRRANLGYGVDPIKIISLGLQDFPHTSWDIQPHAKSNKQIRNVYEFGSIICNCLLIERYVELSNNWWKYWSITGLLLVLNQFRYYQIATLGLPCELRSQDRSTPCPFSQLYQVTQGPATGTYLDYFSGALKNEVWCSCIFNITNATASFKVMSARRKPEIIGPISELDETLKFISEFVCVSTSRRNSEILRQDQK